MKLLVTLLGSVIVSFAAVSVQADTIQDNLLKNYKSGWYPNFYKGKGPLNCSETCKNWVQDDAAESESSLLPNGKTYVCKADDLGQRTLLYGNQVGAVPACLISESKELVQRNDRFHCLCVTKAHPGCPDLVVQSISKPGWDLATSRSVIKAEIKNIGMGEAENTLAQLMDPYTSQHIGVPYSDVAETPALLPGASATVVFHLSYWPYNPTADFTITADYKNTLNECKEKNNVKLYNPLD